MPKENFYDSSRVDGDEFDPDLVVSWGEFMPGVTINGIEYDRSGLNRLIRALKRARKQTFGEDT